MTSGPMVAKKAICRSICEAAMMRERMSRPNWSVPKGCARLGGCSSARVVEGQRIVGRHELGATAQSDERWRGSTAPRRWREAGWRAAAAARACGAHRLTRGSSQHLDQIGDEKGHRDEEREDERQALDHRVVAREDAVDHQPSDARHGEHALGDDGAAEQLADMEADEGDRRDQRVAHHVPRTG